MGPNGAFPNDVPTGCFLFAPQTFPSMAGPGATAARRAGPGFSKLGCLPPQFLPPRSGALWRRATRPIALTTNKPCGFDLRRGLTGTQGRLPRARLRCLAPGVPGHGRPQLLALRAAAEPTTTRKPPVPAPVYHPAGPFRLQRNSPPATCRFSCPDPPVVFKPDFPAARSRPLRLRTRYRSTSGWVAVLRPRRFWGGHRGAYFKNDWREAFASCPTPFEELNRRPSAKFVANRDWRQCFSRPRRQPDHAGLRRRLAKLVRRVPVGWRPARRPMLHPPARPAGRRAPASGEFAERRKSRCCWLLWRPPSPRLRPQAIEDS